MKKSRILCIAAILVTASVLEGCSLKELFHRGEDTAVVYLDYFEQVQAAADGYAPAYELVLREGENGMLLLEEYGAGIIEGSTAKYSYTVPPEAMTACNEVIRRYKMKDWNGLKSYDVLDGKLYELNFTDENGEKFRASSEKMPSDGMEAFDEIKRILTAYVNK